MGNPVTTGLLDNVTNTESYAYDYSRAFGGTQDSSVNSLGSKVNIGDATGATISVVDPGAILAGRDIAETALNSNAAILQKVAGSADSAVQKALDLAGIKTQGDLGTITTGALWLAGIGATAWVLWKIFGGSKKEAKS